MRTWEEKLIFMEYVEEIDGIYWAVLNQQEQILAKCQDAEELNLEQLWIETVQKGAESKTPFLYEVGENIYMWIFTLEERHYVFRPACTKQVTSMQVHNFAHQYQLKEKEINRVGFYIV